MPVSMQPHIHILLPTHNNHDILNQSLASLLKQDYSRFSILVVDAHSTDHTLHLLQSLQKKHTNLKCITVDSANWWTGSMHAGILYLLDHARTNDYVLTLNDDIYIKPNYLSTLTKQIQSLPPQSILGSICFSDKNKSKVIEPGRKIEWGRDGGFTHRLKLPKNFQQLPPVQVDALSGKGTLIPITAFQQAGNYSSKLPHYGADYELSIRARRAGFPLYLSYQAQVFNLKPEGNQVKLPTNPVLRFFHLAFSKRSKQNLIYNFTYTFLVTPAQYWPNSTKIILHRLFQKTFQIKP